MRLHGQPTSAPPVCAGMLLLANLMIAALTTAAAQGLTAGSRPNLLLIVADDLGYLDLGFYGSEMRTPNIDRLAATGLVLTNFYAGTQCAPTRAMLLSGTDNHLAGVGTQGRVLPDHPGYAGYLNYRVMSVAQRLRASGYHTYMTGKWHLGSAPDQIPSSRGFERSFSLIDPGAGHFGDMSGIGRTPATYRMDGEHLASLPEDFYSSIAYTQHMIDFIQQGIEAEDAAPFFGYLAFTAPHWPIHALDEDIARQHGNYDEGWDVIRARRFERWQALGFGPADADLPEPTGDYVPWDSLTPAEQALEARTMEAYAAMVERMDTEIGRLLAYLEGAGILDDTLVMFISDNGAEGGRYGSQESDSYYDNSLENIGRIGSYRYIGPGWAEAGTAPYRLRKTYTAEGGVHVPAILNAPALGVPAGRNAAVTVVYDIAATFLELAGTSGAGVGSTLLPVTGRSFADVLRGEPGAGRPAQEFVAFEHGGHRGVRRGDFKALWITGRFGPDRWELFDLATDPGEQHDVSAEHPEIMAEMLREWDAYVRANDVVIPLPPVRTRGRGGNEAGED